MKIQSGGGWRAILYVLKRGWLVGFIPLWKALSSRNACKTCALGMGGQKGGMTNERGAWPEVCKKSVQAMISDMQGEIRPEFFQQPVKKLQGWSSQQLEAAGRLAFPVRLREGESQYQPISWEEAFDSIAASLKKTKPDRSFFYFSGRSSNEAGFLLQLFARVYGTNNVNNCSFYCHQASGVALGDSIGTATATVSLEDLENADFVILAGANPASNHPRLMTVLKNIRRRGGEVIVINPLREMGLLRFSVPSDPRSLFFGSAIATEYLQVKIGGDIALYHGIAKALLESHPQALAPEFLAQSTEGYNEYHAMVGKLTWAEIEEASGIHRAMIDQVAKKYARSENAVFAWCMGLTHHEHGVANIQTLVNIALLRGMVGRKNAGLLPIRGHSNVQGMGSMAVTPTLKNEVFNRLIEAGIQAPTNAGLDTMACVQAAGRGEVDLAFCLGGNLFGSNPDATQTHAAFHKIGTVVYLNTTLNTGHAWGLGKETIILPVCARDEELESTTQESMFSYVRLSDGGKRRVSGIRSEVDIITEIGARVLPNHSILDWKQLKHHEQIRQWIAKIIPGYEAIGKIDQTKEEFHIPGRILHQPRFSTPSGKAKFTLHPIPPTQRPSEKSLRLLTLRSEGQFNTVVYDDGDLYRGQERRDVVLLNSKDMERMRLRKNDRVSVVSKIGKMDGLLVRPFDIKEGCAAMYYPEANRLVGSAVDPRSKTPGFKSTWVEIT